MNDAFHYCAELTRKRDRDRYVVALLAPERQKSDLMALYAFNTELAEIGAQVSEPLLGQMRLRWWLDSLPALFDGAPPGQPVAQALSAVIRRSKLPKTAFELMIEAREKDLEPQPFQTMADLETYGAAVSARLIELALTVCGVELGDAERAAAYHLGRAWTLAGLLRTVPHTALQGRILLPITLCETHKLSISELQNGTGGAATSAALCSLVKTLREAAQRDLKQVRHHWAATGRKALSPMLLARLAAAYLQQLADADDDPFALRQRPPGPRVRDLLMLKWDSLTNTI